MYQLLKNADAILTLHSRVNYYNLRQRTDKFLRKLIAHGWQLLCAQCCFFIFIYLHRAEIIVSAIGKDDVLVYWARDRQNRLVHSASRKIMLVRFYLR